MYTYMYACRGERERCMCTHTCMHTCVLACLHVCVTVMHFRDTLCVCAREMHCFLCCRCAHRTALCVRQAAAIHHGGVFRNCAGPAGLVGLGSAAAAACSCLAKLDACNFRSFFAEKRAKETRYAPAKRRQFTARVSCKIALGRLCAFRNALDPRQRPAAAIVEISLLRRGRRRRDMRLPTAAKSTLQ